MDIRHISYFVETAHCGSITQAAQKLHITQPALSRSICSLEEELGKILFIRKPGKIIITEDGKAVLHYAEELLKHFNDFQNRFQTTDKEFQMLKIGCSPLISTLCFPDMLSTFSNKTLGITYIENSVDQLIYYIIDNKLDAAICMICNPSHEFSEQIVLSPVHTGIFTAITADENIAASSYFEDLNTSGINIITSCGMYQYNNQLPKYHTICYSDNLPEIIKKVNSKHFLALVPDFTISHFPANIRTINTRNQLKYTIALITSKKIKRSHLIARLKTYLLQEETFKHNVY